MAVWLLAARFAKDYEAALDTLTPHGGWPDFFMTPENRCRRPCVFLGDSEDRKVLNNWLDYARQRVNKLERRLMVWMLVDSLGNPENQAKLRRAS